MYFLLFILGFSWKGCRGLTQDKGEKKWLTNGEIKILYVLEENMYFQLCASHLLPGSQGGYLMDVSVCLISAILIEDFKWRISDLKLIQSSMCSKTRITSLPRIQKSYTKILFAWCTLVMLHTSSQQGSIVFWARWRGDTTLLLLLCRHPKMLASELFRHLERKDRIKDMLAVHVSVGVWSHQKLPVTK